MTLCVEQILLVDVRAGSDEFELAVDVEAEGGEVLLEPGFGVDHGEHVSPAGPVEVVGLADDGFEVDVGFVGEFVPVEVVDGGDVLLADFDELLLEVAFDLGDAAGFEVGEVVGGDGGGEGGRGVGEKGLGGLFFGDLLVEDFLGFVRCGHRRHGRLSGQSDSAQGEIIR